MPANPITAQAIIFAINAGIKLSRNIQKAYAKSVKSKAIVLPIPKFNGSPDAESAHTFFKKRIGNLSGRRFVASLNEGGEDAVYIEHLDYLFRKYDHHKGRRDFPNTGFENNGDFTNKDEAEYIKYFESFHALSRQLQNPDQANKDLGFSDEDFVHLLRIRQWEQGKMPGITPLQLVAGSLVEIGIDYFNQVPGALNKGSSFGVVMQHVLIGFDSVNFAEGNLKHIGETVIPRLFIAAAEAVSELSTSISKDPNLQLFIEQSSQGIASDLLRRLKEIEADNHLNPTQKHNKKDVAIQWGQVLSHSLIKNAGSYVFTHPADLLDTNEGGSAIISSLGTTILDTILEEDTHGINFQAAFNIDMLDRLVSSAMGIVAQYPSLISNKDGIREIVVGVSQAIADSGIQQPGLLPELVRLILELTSDNLPVLWPDHQNLDSRHLLLIATQQLLAAISRPSADGKDWTLELSTNTIIAIAENILEEIVTNPHWVTPRRQQPSLLQEVLDAVFLALAEIPKEERISPHIISYLIQVSLHTATQSQHVLDKIQWADDDAEATILSKALNILSLYIFQSDFVDESMKTTLFVDLLDYIMEVILRYHPNKKGLILIDLILFDSPHINYQNGFSEELLDDIVTASIYVLEQHPDLVSNNQAIQIILRQVMEAMIHAGYTNWEQLPNLFRLVLQYSAMNADLILIADPADEPKYLLIIALQQLLLNLGHQGTAEEWSPHLTEDDIHTIIDDTFAIIAQHPEWVAMLRGDKGIFGQVITHVFDALLSLPPQERLTPQTMQLLLQLALQTAANNPEVLDSIHWADDNSEQIILNKALNLVFAFVFDDTPLVGISKIDLLEDLLEYVLSTIIAYHPNAKGLILVDLVLFKDPNVEYNQGFDRVLADQLIDATLRVLYTYPDLVSNQIAIQAIVSDLAMSISASSFRQANILPELLRLTLEKTGQNAALIIQTEDNKPQFLLLLAIQLLLEKLSYKEDGESWSPQLSEAEALAIAHILTDELVAHPEWMYTGADTTSLFNQVIDSVFLTLAKMPQEERFTTATLEWLLRNAVRTAGSHPSILANIAWGKEEEQIIILNQALDLIFSYVFAKDENDEYYLGSRQALFVELIEYTLSVILEAHPNKKGLLLLHLILFEDDKLDLRKPFDQEQADALIASALVILEARPELIAREAILQKLISDIATALRQSGLKRDYLFNEFLRLALFHIGENIDLLINIRTTGPKHILAEALRQILKSLASPPKRGKWKPQLTDQQLLEIVDHIFTEISLNPQWVDNNEFLLSVLDIIHDGLGVLPKHIKLHHGTYVLLILACLKAAAKRKHLIINFISVDGEQQQLALAYSLEGLFLELYDGNGESAGSWTLTQTDAMNAIIEYYLLRLSEVPTTQEEIDIAKGKIGDAIDAINNNLAFTLEDLLEQLKN